MKNAYKPRLSATVTVLLITLCVEMMGLIGAGNNPQVLMTVAVAVAIEEASK